MPIWSSRQRSVSRGGESPYSPNTYRLETQPKAPLLPVSRDGRSYQYPQSPPQPYSSSYRPPTPQSPSYQSQSQSPSLRGQSGSDTYRSSQRPINTQSASFQDRNTSLRGRPNQTVYQSSRPPLAPQSTSSQGRSSSVRGPSTPTRPSTSRPSSSRGQTNPAPRHRSESQPPATKSRGRSSSCSGRLSADVETSTYDLKHTQKLTSRKTSGFPRPMYGSGAFQTADSIASFRSPDSSASAPLYPASQNDFFRDAHQARAEKGRRPPYGSKFERMTREYHKEERAAKALGDVYWNEIEYRAINRGYTLNNGPDVGNPPAPKAWHRGASVAADKTAEHWGRSADGRREMSEAWPGYDSHNTYSGHRKAREYASVRQGHFDSLAHTHQRWSQGR